MRFKLVVIFLFSVIGLSTQTFAQCQADAGQNVTICQGESVTLGGNPTAVDPNNPGNVTYDWNNGAADVANPVVSPNQTTTYEVELSGGGCSGEDDQITVTVLPAPNANFTAAPQNQCGNLPVNFTNTTTGCNNCQYSWNFGDPSSGSNNTSTAQNPSHTFTSFGSGTQTYTVTLTVTNGNNQCTDTQTLQVTVKQIPDASLIDPVTSFAQCSGDANFPLTVFDASTPATNASYVINWGDGTPNWTGTTAPTGVAHTYTQNEVFDLVYTVTGSNGCSDSQTIFVSNITNPSIGAANPGGTTGCGPLEICFPLNNYQANHSSTTYTVDFGDGSPTQILNHPPPATICHTYTGSSCTSTGGAYTFTIIADNLCDMSVATITPVRVYTGPTAAFTATPNPACVNSAISFLNTSVLGYNNQCQSTTLFTWSWGDGTANTVVTSNATQSHSYSLPGTYTVTLTAQNSCGTNTISQQVCVETAPTPQFTVSGNLGCVPYTVNTTNTSNNGTPCALNYTWLVDYVDLPCDPDNGSYSFTGGTSSSSLQPSFNLQSVGTYTLRLQMSNSCGVFQDTEVITVNTVPVVAINSIGTVCAGTSVSPSALVDNCNLPISSYAWTFNNGTPASSTSLSPGAVTYANAGSYPISFTATNACGPSTANSTVTVLPIPNVQISTTSATNSTCINSPITLSASGAGSYTWSPSSFLNTTSGSSVISTPSSGTTVTYTVTGNSGTCSDTETITVTVNPLPVVASGGPFVMCNGETEQLSVNVSGGLPPYVSYSWGNGSTLNSTTSPTPTSSATATTTYPVSVTDSRGCVGTTNVTLTVNPLPVVNAGNDLTLCNQPVPTTLTGYTPTTGGTGVWSGSSNVTSAGVFTPSATGTQTLTYCFTNSTTGCQACDNILVTVVNPTAANGGPDTTACFLGSPIVLPSGGTWSGSSQVTSAGVFTGTIVGPVTLTYSVGTGSCLTSDQVVVNVLAPPTANAGPDQTICAGTTVTLASSGTSTNGTITGYFWSGGTVSNPTLATVTATPTITTVYNVTMVDASGCPGSDAVTVTVNPLPVVNAGADIQLCDQPVATQLTGFSPATGGTWSGQNVSTGGSYSPNGTGQFTLTYTYQNPTTLCTNSDQLVVTVITATVANAGPDINLCQSNTPVQIVPGNTGGTWSPAPVTSTGSFTPNTPGVYNLTYSIGSGTCLTTDQMVFTVYSLPTANAGLDASMCVGDSVSLQGSATGGLAPYGYAWNNGATLTNANQSSTLAFPPATTTYQLTVTDAHNCVSTDDVIVNVNTLPVVNAGNNLTLCDQPITETLTGFSPTTGGVGTWSGTGITNPNGQFVSPGVGTYWLYYTFTAGGNSCQNVDSIQVTVNPPVIANAGPNLTLCLNEGTYQLTGFNPPTGGTWTGTGITNASNGVFESGIMGVGTHTLTLSYGTGTCFSSDQTQVTIQPLPVVTAGTNQTLCGNALPFNMAGYSPTSGGTWEGPGITNGTQGTFDPAIGAGSYNVFYWFTDPITGCADTSFKTVTISPVPVANFSVAPLGCTNAPVDLTNTSTGANSYEWNYGNGHITSGFDPNYTYPNPGIFDIMLVASNNFGCRDTASNSNEIINPPVASLALLPADGCAPLNVTFDNLSVGQYLTYNWNLSVTTSTAFIPPGQTYQQGPDVLTYPISLTATNFCGSNTDNDIVTVYPQPVAAFGTDLDVFCSPFTVNINNTSTGNPDVFTWEFSDGGPQSFVEEPGSHVFFADTIPVDYTIYLYLSNECGVDTTEYTITVLPNTVTAFFNTNVIEGCTPLNVEFTDFSEGGTQIQYNFGDDTFTGNANPTHVYSDPGIYTIYQYIDNGCSYDTAQMTLEVFPSPVIDFTTDVPNMCENEMVHFDADPGTAIDITWDFGDGTGSTLSDPDHLYINGGNYIVTMTGVSDNLCSTSVSHPFTVYNAPDASFTIPNQVGCSPFTACFSNATSGGIFYEWDFGDGNTDNDSDVCNTYINVGNEPILYTVSLIAQNMQLCADTLQMDVIVSPQPVSAFALSTFESCYIPVDVTTSNFSTDANSFDWYLDGQLQSDELNAEFTFDAVGEYNVELVASNQFGCSSSSDVDFTVHPLPVVAFTADPTEGCVPLTVNFNNTSTGGQSYLWDFGDGRTATGVNAIHEYNDPGLFDISLVVTTDMGCMDTLEYEDMIAAWNLPVASFDFNPQSTDIYQPYFDFFDTSYDAHEWLWNFGDGGVSSIPVIRHYYEEAGVFPVTLTVWTEHGCRDDVIRSVNIDDIFQVYVPNAFTPDGDGINDEFWPHLTGLDFIENYKFVIIDRWGTTIFETNDPSAPWLGDVREGVYYAKDEAYTWQVVVQLKGVEGERIMSGHVIMIR